MNTVIGEAESCERCGTLFSDIQKMLAESQRHCGNCVEGFEGVRCEQAPGHCRIAELRQQEEARTKA